MPTYNSAKFIDKTLKSVIGQSSNNWELLIVDNNSSDETIKIIGSYSDERIKIFSINNNGIIGKSRNLGISEALGEWICFLDSDDYWYADKLKHIEETIKKEPIMDVFVHNEHLVEFDRGFPSKVLRYGYFDNLKNEAYKYMLLNGNKLSTSATSVRAKFINDNQLFFSENISLVTVEDYDYWLRIALKKGIFQFSSKVLGAYVVHSKSASSNFVIHDRNNLYLIKYHCFEVQDFENNSSALWKKLRRLQLFKCKLKQTCKKNVSKINLLKIFFSEPSFLMSYLYHRYTSKVYLIIRDIFQNF